jgi:ATP-binding cassette subfamily B protein
MFKLLKYSKGYVLPALLSPLFVMTDTIMQVLIPLIMADIIDIGITNSDQLYVTQHGLIMIGLALGSLVFGYLSGYFATKASAGLGKNLRKDLFEKIQSYSFSNIDKFSASSLITRLTTDVTNVQQSFQMIIRIFFRAPVMFVFALIMAYTRNVELSNIFSIAAVCLILIVLIVVYPANKLYRQMFKKYDRMNLVTQENINGIKTVKAYTTEGDENKKFAQASKETRYYATKADTLGVLVSPMATAVIYITSLIVAYIGGQMIVVGTMKAGELTLVYYLCGSDSVCYPDGLCHNNYGCYVQSQCGPHQSGAR